MKNKKHWHPILQMKNTMLLIAICSLLFSCENENTTTVTEKNEKDKTETVAKKVSIINENGNTIETRIATPASFSRTNESANSNATYFRNLKLKPNNSKVLLYNGQEKGNQEAHIAVLTLDVGKQDLQQCADAVMRLHAEYLYSQKKYKQISFNFTNGFKANYDSWIAGKRISVQGNKCAWVNTYEEGNSYEGFRSYLTKVYNYAGSLSLSKQLEYVPNFEDIEIGDVIIRGGSPGHAVTVMDIAMNSKGEKLFLLSQSYMPAQDIQILKNPINEKISPWYAVNDISSTIYTPEYTFDKRELMRFKKDN